MAKKKYKGTILTCGYYCLNSAVLGLAKKGWRIVKLHRMPNPVIENVVIDESDGLAKLQRDMLLEVSNVLDERSAATGERLHSRVLTNDEWMMLATLGIGGKQFAETTSFLGIAAARLSSSVVNINATYDYFHKMLKKYPDIKAVLVHTAEGSTYRSLVEAARLEGIPTFCCLNGTISGTSTKFAAHTLYQEADYYYLHGEYDVGYIKARLGDQYEEEYCPLVGQPSFDQYYKGGKIKTYEVEDNSFLYCCAVLCGVYHLPILDVEATIQMIDFAMFSKVLPPNTDGMFFEGFARYQREENPDAKLSISLRPYYTLRAEDFARYVGSFGIKNFKVYDHELDAPARELIPKHKYVISAESTILIESMLNRRGVVYLTGSDGGIGNKFKGTEEWTSHCAVDDPSDISAALVGAVENHDEYVAADEKWAAHYNYNDDGKAGNRLAKDMDRRIS